jgi:two-component system osmolarity sensor histidine kinase EnvZ
MVRRVTVLAALVGLFAFATQLLVMGLWLRPPMDKLMFSDASRARLAKIALEQAPPSQRASVAARLSSETLQVDQQAPPVHAADRDLPAGLAPDGLVDRLRANAEPGVEVRFAPPPGFISYGFVLDGQQWWVHLRGPGGVPTGLLNTLLIWLALLGAAALAGLVFGVRWIARPIALLSEQIMAQRGRMRPVALDMHASAEMQTLARAFNELAEQVEAANAYRQQLLAGVSHDLRTPLARLRLRVETQCPRLLADELTTDLLALEHIVGQFLAYVQGDTGMRAGRHQALADTVRNVVERYTSAGQPVTAQLAAVDWPAPDLAVQRLLTNLIDNALAYGRAPVDVLLEARDDGAVLSVCDRGPGMSAQQFGRAQLPFVRLDGNRSELGHCGLGLAIVAQITAHLDGKLSLQPPDSGRPFAISVFIPRQD